MDKCKDGQGSWGPQVPLFLRLPGDSVCALVPHPWGPALVQVGEAGLTAPHHIPDKRKEKQSGWKANSFLF